MKRTAVAMIVGGICLEVLAIFGNRGPFPLVNLILSPNYIEAHRGYQTLLETNMLAEGDAGFDLIRVAFMNLTVMGPEPPFPIDEIDGVTLTRFLVGASEDPEALRERTPVFLEYSNGEVTLLDLNYVRTMANGLLSRWTVFVNLTLVALGCTLVFYGLRALLLSNGRADAGGLVKTGLAV